MCMCWDVSHKIDKLQQQLGVLHSLEMFLLHTKVESSNVRLTVVWREWQHTDCFHSCSLSAQGGHRYTIGEVGRTRKYPLTAGGFEAHTSISISNDVYFIYFVYTVLCVYSLVVVRLWLTPTDLLFLTFLVCASHYKTMFVIYKTKQLTVPPMHKPPVSIVHLLHVDYIWSKWACSGQMLFQVLCDLLRFNYGLTMED